MIHGYFVAYEKHQSMESGRAMLQKHEARVPTESHLELQDADGDVH